MTTSGEAAPNDLATPSGHPVWFAGMEMGETQDARRRHRLWAVVALLIGLAGSAALIFSPVDWTSLGSAGYVGIFVVTLVATGSFFAPLPYFIAIGVAATYLNPLLVALVAAVAATLGESMGYVIGIGGRSLVPDNKWSRRIEYWIERWGVYAIFFLSLIPNPFFDAVGFIAGALGYSRRAFVTGVFTGKLLRFIAIAYFGLSLSLWHPFP